MKNKYLINLIFFVILSGCVGASSSGLFGTGVTIAQARPSQGGVTIPENQVISIEGGKVVHTSTDERGNFLIGDDFTINQQTGTITGDSFNKSIQATLTPLIIALGGQ